MRNDDDLCDEDEAHMEPVDKKKKKKDDPGNQGNPETVDLTR